MSHLLVLEGFSTFPHFCSHIVPPGQLILIAGTHHLCIFAPISTTDETSEVYFLSMHHLPPINLGTVDRLDT